MLPPLCGMTQKRHRRSDAVMDDVDNLDGPLNLVGTEASGTSVHMARSPVDNGLNPLHIGLPGTIGTSVGVGHLNTKGHALTTKITLRHSLHLPSA